MICIMPDLAYFISMLSRYMDILRSAHWKALKWGLRYVKGTLKNGLIYRGWANISNHYTKGYTDVDYAMCLDSRKSILRYLFTLFKGVVN